MTWITSSQRSDMTAADHSWSSHHSLPRPDNRRPAPLDLVMTPRRSSSRANSIGSRRGIMNERRLLEACSWRLKAILVRRELVWSPLADSK